MKRVVGLFLFLVLTSVVVFTILLNSSEKYPAKLHAGFQRPVEFNGVELLKGYPNAVTHVVVFRFKESPVGKNVWELEEVFDVAPDYLIIEIQNGSTLFCRAKSENGTFVFRGETCYGTLDEALTRRITLTGCLDATYIGHRLERNSILIFEFRAAKETTCVNKTVEVRGRLYDVLVRIETGNGTVEFPVKRVEGNYLTDEVYEIQK
ncbi:hypothetical protein [Thermococcus peptonophilus]|uniref:Uncharacterized protein n=1 Tax=Thermococcus peptonophilus TaxID=53952 RepID=A0A142CVB4_9EURY|nr:hypothetical protein [Thermococcus peptonophilus]AMQ18716.1 hypothetical protein A0127_05800 [Thermococcus peptonophilus]